MVFFGNVFNTLDFKYEIECEEPLVEIARETGQRALSNYFHIHELVLFQIKYLPRVLSLPLSLW